MKSKYFDLLKKMVTFWGTMSKFFGSLWNDMIKNKTFFLYIILGRVKISQSFDIYGPIYLLIRLINSTI